MTVEKAKERIKTYNAALKASPNVSTEIIEAFDIAVKCIEIVENLYQILPEGGVGNG